MMSSEFAEEVLQFLGWEKNGSQWTHPEYRKEPGPRPELNDGDVCWWILDWLIERGLKVTFIKTENKKCNKKYLLCRDYSGRKKWTVRDIPRECPNEALVSLVLKIKRFPKGMPKDRDLLRQYAGLEKTPEIRQLFSISRAQLRETQKKIRDLEGKMKREIENAMAQRESDTEEIQEDLPK